VGEHRKPCRHHPGRHGIREILMDVAGAVEGLELRRPEQCCGVLGQRPACRDHLAKLDA
jgi:hypothetical protein